MSQLLRHVLDGSMILIELDGSITVPQIVEAIDAQPRSRPANGCEAGSGVKRIGSVTPGHEGLSHLLQLLLGHPALLQCQLPMHAAQLKQWFCATRRVSSSYRQAVQPPWPWRPMPVSA